MKAIITIGREYGSGGREIGIRLGEKLGVPVYDKEIISMAAKQTQFDPRVVQSIEEKAPRYFIPTGLFDYSVPISDQVYLAQSQVIRRLAEQGPCILIGRCADYILEEMGSINFFVYANFKSRVQRKQSMDLVNPPDNIEKHVRSIDRSRAKYYSHYTGREWGRAHNYHMCIDSDKAGITGCAELMEHFLNLHRMA